MTRVQALAFLLAIFCFTGASRAGDLEHYRQALGTALAFDGSEHEFLMMNLPQALGNPLDTDEYGSPSDVDFMDFVPHEQFEWTASSARVSAVYSSLFNNYRLGYVAASRDDRARYDAAMRRLYQPPDPALIARGELPTLQLTDRALDYFTRNVVLLSRLLSEDRSGATVSDLLDIVIASGLDTEISRALLVIRDFLRNDVDSVWATRAGAVESGIFRMEVTPSRDTWTEHSGWASVVLTASTNPALGIRLDVKLVRVRRGWLDERLFTARNWYSVDSSNRILNVSTGQPLVAGGNPSNSLLRLLPEQFVLARNVQRIGVWTLADEQTLPLSLRPAVSDAGQASAPSVIAVICKRVPKSPNPDPSLEWPLGLPK